MHKRSQVQRGDVTGWCRSVTGARRPDEMKLVRGSESQPVHDLRPLRAFAGRADVVSTGAPAGVVVPVHTNVPTVDVGERVDHLLGVSEAANAALVRGPITQAADRPFLVNEDEERDDTPAWVRRLHAELKKPRA